MLENIKDIDINLIMKSIPQSQKPIGISKIPSIISNKGNSVKKYIIPNLMSIAEDLGIKNISSTNPKQPESCIPKEQLIKNLNKRNNLVQSLNDINKKLNDTLGVLTGINNTFNVLSITVTGLKLSKSILALTSQTLPTTPGAIPATLSILDDIKDIFLFDKNGNPKLAKISSILDSSTLSISMLNEYIKDAIDVLKNIDINFNKCINKNEIKLEEINPNLLLINNSLNENPNINSDYKGFYISIEEVPFTSKVNRFKAVGKNREGIQLIETELSFTTNKQTLIEELKLRIDNNNLKAY